jgi:hypothetical protein
MQDFVRSLEIRLAHLLKHVPHLPKETRDWLATSSWWLIFVVALLSGITALGAFVGFMTKLSVSGVTSAGALWTFDALISLVFTIIVTVLFATAIAPLKALEKKGWVLVFAALLVEFIAVIVSAITSLLGIGGVHDFVTTLIGGVIGLILGAYFLYEIRGYFSLPARTLRATSKK